MESRKCFKRQFIQTVEKLINMISREYSEIESLQQDTLSEVFTNQWRLIQLDVAIQTMTKLVDDWIRHNRIIESSERDGAVDE
jgi:DNA-directed RNA polymerase alpha subunit